MSCIMNCHPFCDRYDHEEDLLKIANSLLGAKVRTAVVIDDGSQAYLELSLEDGRVIKVGVTGNLHDEAYLLFNERRKM